MRDGGSAIRREQLRALLASVPVLLIAWFLVGAIGTFSARPVAVAALLLPLAIVVSVLGYPLVRDRRLVLGGGFLPFFVAYCLLFSIAAGTQLLEGKRATLLGFEAETPSNVLGLSRLGDWHYWLAPAAPPMTDVIVVTLPSFEGDTLELARRAQADLIVRVVARQARGIAFDYYLEQPSGADRILCFQIGRAEAAGVPVVYGYRVRDRDGTPSRVPLAPDIDRCLGPEQLGTLTGLMESDNHVRMVPTSHLADTTLRSFSWRIAALLARGDSRLPQVGLVQFVAPARLPPVLHAIPGRFDELDAERFRDRFVVVGSDRPGDIRATAVGSMPGALIHALAAHSLRTGHVIRRVDARWLLPAIFLMCWVLTLLQAKGGGVRALLIGAGLCSAATVASAAFAIRAGLLWIDVSYPLVAVWGMTGVLSGGARLQRGRTRPLETPEPATGGDRVLGPFDVFLSHNSRDEASVIALGTALRERGIRPWLDQWELVPGRPWQKAVEEIIETARSAAVLIGKDGIGPWEEAEMRACLGQCVDRAMPVIPVLLPGAASHPKLPPFLTGFTWVDLRKGLDDTGLDRLQWGITGIKPTRSHRSRSSASPPA